MPGGVRTSPGRLLALRVAPPQHRTHSGTRGPDSLSAPDARPPGTERAKAPRGTAARGELPGPVRRSSCPS
ncbi:hypothetical protein SBRY_90271 [Actinacidiphila bryophytorum]|uniref:Uncharacterized protein n=1 Tax=Actinacidiphila bryophytorum TaxID=1436133 RepID=A0A9W4H7V7_9ACTN|nr:hypothetical protein SBRY_90271 [Actinacidiphila bryophytorum]